MKYVVARNYREATDFARVNEWPKSEWRYVDMADRLFGLKDAHVYLIGYWREHTWSRDIGWMLETQQKLGRCAVEEVRDWR